MEGVAALKGAPAGEYCCPTSNSAVWGPGKNQNLEAVTLLNSLKKPDFCWEVQPELKIGVMLPNSLKLLNFGVKFPPEL